MKSLLELADIIVIESIDVELHNANDLVVVSCSCGHLDLPFAGLFAVVSRVDRAASSLSFLSLIPNRLPPPPEPTYRSKVG